MRARAASLGLCLCLLLALLLLRASVHAAPLSTAASSSTAVSSSTASPSASAEASSCPAACECELDARLWAWLPREESLSAQCARRRLRVLPRGDADLRHLDAAGNQLDALRAGELAALDWHQLLTLDLSDNALARVEDGALRGLGDLRRVLLARNRITTLPPNLFSQCAHVWYLSLAGNPLVVVPDSASGRALLAAPSLQVLDLSDCKLTEFPDHALGNANGLKELAVANNSISEVRVVSLKHLRRLDVSDNRVRKLPPSGVSAAPELRSLTLDGNPLGNFEGEGEGEWALPGGEALRALSAERCGLRRLDAAAVAALPRLEELSLDDNALLELPPDTLAALPRLRRLSLRRNRLRAPPAVHHAELRALDLSGNGMRLPGNASWLSAPALRALHLAHCALREVPSEALGGAPVLRDLGLAHNALRWLGAQLVAELPRLRALDLRGNPLRCDAALRPLWLASEARRVRVEATCLEPPGDWELLRFAGDINATTDQVERLQLQEDDSASVEEEEDDDDLTEELVRYSVRWGPVLGGFLMVVASVFLLRKWLVYMNIKRYNYYAKSEEYVYDSEDEDTTTTTMITVAGSPCAPPLALASPPPPPAPAPAAADVFARTRFAVAPTVTAPAGPQTTATA